MSPKEKVKRPVPWDTVYTSGAVTIGSMGSDMFFGRPDAAWAIPAVIPAVMAAGVLKDRVSAYALLTGPVAWTLTDNAYIGIGVSVAAEAAVLLGRVSDAMNRNRLRNEAANPSNDDDGFGRDRVGDEPRKE